MDISVLSPEDQALYVSLQAKLQQNAAVSAPTKKPRKRRTQVKNFTPHEIDLFFKAIDNPRDYAIFRLMYHRGLRASEIGMLQMSNVDMRAETISFDRLKGSRSGVGHHMTSNEIRALRAYLKVRGTDPGILFPSREGKPISQQRLDQIIKAYGAKAGLPREKCHCHTIKHSTGTHLRLLRNFTLEDIQHHLGHVNIENTRKYVDHGGEVQVERDKRLRSW